MYQRKKDGLYHDPATGRTWEHQGYATRIHWNPAMLTFLRRHYATTFNEELAQCLGVSPRTMIRKARELGLVKDPEWLRRIWDERRHMAHAVSKRKGYPGTYRKGERASPNTEFKPGHRLTDEQRARQSEGMKRYWRRHPEALKAKAAKAKATRQRKKAEQNF